MAQQLQKIYKSAKEYTGTAANVAIVAATGGLEQLTSIAAFRCPCVDVTDLNTGCINATVGSASCSQLLNFGYGVSYIIAPAVALFALGMAANPKLWKCLTGCLNKTQKYKLELPSIAWALLMVTGKAFLSPLVWVCVSLLDGKYLACAISSLPYDVGRTGFKYTDCDAVPQSSSNLIFSENYIKNSSFSQILGWILTGVLVLFGLTIYAVIQCTFPLTYYQAKYYKLYREEEEEEFDREMKETAEKETKEDVDLFMAKPRTKSSWDYISTIYEFDRERKSKNNIASYSNLQRCAQQSKPSNDIPDAPANGIENNGAATATTTI